MDYESRIKAFCAKALNAEGEELDKVISQLRVSIREHALRLENKNALLSFPAFRADAENLVI